MDIETSEGGEEILLPLLLRLVLFVLSVVPNPRFSMRYILPIALLTLTALSASVSAQGSQTVLGGGCLGAPAPVVHGPLTLGSRMEIRDAGCFISSPGSFYILAFGIPLPQGFSIPIVLQQFNPVICQITVIPVIAVPSRTEPMLLSIPNAPALRGARVGLQSYCFVCGFRGCDQVLSQGLEITIG